MIVTLSLIGAAALILVTTIWGLLSRYRRSAPDELLVVFGKAGKVTNDEGKTIVTPSKIIQGGGAFVWPIIQDFKKMSMKPIQIKVTVDGIDSQAIPMHLPVVLTTAISQDKIIQQNAATRFLSATPTEIEKQISEILIGETRAIMATMLIEEINADRNTFLGKVRESLEQELTKVGYDVTNINISEITDDADYIKNLGKKAETKARANAEADIAEQTKQGNIKIANTKKEEEIAVADAEREKQVQVNQTKQEQEVKVAEINREKQIKLAEAEKERESGVAVQEAEKAARIAEAQADAESNKAKAMARQVAAVAAAEADAESKKAEFEATQTKNIAKAEADAEAAQNEAEALKQVRIAKAKQEQEAETIKATQEKEAKAAEYESNKRQRKAEQDKLAGVAEQEAKIDVAKARAKAAQAEADAVKVGETAKVEAEMAVAKTRQERQLEVNKAQAKAAEEQLNATEIVPAQKAKEKAVIEAEAIKRKAELEAEAVKARMLREAEAEAESTRIKLNAEAEGIKNKLMAEAEGKRASLMAEAEALQQKELAPAMAFEKMVEVAGGRPDLAVQWKTVDHLEGIAGAQAEALSKVSLGNVTVYGDASTGGKFVKELMANVTPAIDMISTGMKDPIKNLLGIGKTQTPTLDNPTNPNPSNGGDDLLPDTGNDTDMKNNPDKEDDKEFDTVK